MDCNNGLRSGGLNTSEVIFMSESQFNYLFTLKNVYLSLIQIAVIFECNQILR